MENNDNEKGRKTIAIRYPVSLESDIELIKGLFGYADRPSKNKAFISGVRVAAAYIRRTKFKKGANVSEKQAEVSKSLSDTNLFHFPWSWKRY